MNQTTHSPDADIAPAAEGLDRLWDEQPEVIRQFVENRQRYELLCGEVAYIIATTLKRHHVELAAISHRVKTLDSFADKVFRKQYDDPAVEVTDIAGVRIVFLYMSDRQEIEKLIESEFEVVEKIDKADEVKDEQFGYLALHYLVKLGRKSSGARYDDLKDMTCEIQVRTVLQDAWSIVNHHISYKQKYDVPKPLRRRLARLSGLFELADDEFDRLRSQRQEYVASVRQTKSDENVFLKREVNSDTLAEYVTWRFPDHQVTSSDSILSGAVRAAKENGFDTLDKLEVLLKETEKAREQFRETYPTRYGVAEVARALALRIPAYLESGWKGRKRQLLKEVAGLVEA